MAVSRSPACRTCWLLHLLLHQGWIQDFWRGGGILGLQAKKGDPGGGPTLGPMLKRLYRGPKGGRRPPGPPPPPGSAHVHSCKELLFVYSYLILASMLCSLDIKHVTMICLPEVGNHIMQRSVLSTLADFWLAFSELSTPVLHSINFQGGYS